MLHNTNMPSFAIKYACFFFFFFFFFFLGGGGGGGFFTHQCQNCPAPYLSFCHYLFLLLINYVNLIQYSTEQQQKKICLHTLWLHMRTYVRIFCFVETPVCFQAPDNLSLSTLQKYILKPPFIFLRVHVQNTANRPTLQYNLNETNE